MLRGRNQNFINNSYSLSYVWRVIIWLVKNHIFMYCCYLSCKIPCKNSSAP